MSVECDCVRIICGREDEVNAFGHIVDFFGESLGERCLCVDFLLC